jgi:hypothetical protein
MTVKKHGQYLTSIQPLDDDFGILIEFQNEMSFISLIFLDLYAQTVQKLTTIEHRCRYAVILVNQSDPSQFALDFDIDGEWSIQLCKVVKTEIILTEVINLPFGLSHFYDGRIYGFVEDDDGMIVRDLHVILFKFSDILGCFSSPYLQY